MEMGIPAGLLLARGPADGEFVAHHRSAAAYAEGDAQFLDQSRLYEPQIRPLLASERTPRSVGSEGPGVMLLIIPGPPELRAVVRLSYPYRANRRSNCLRALEQVEKFDPRVGQLFRVAMAAGSANDHVGRR